MRSLLLLLFIAGCYVATDAVGKCSRPYLQRSKVFIYSSYGKVPVKVTRCNFNNTQRAYSDVSDNCVNAFHSGVFLDKWGGKNSIEDNPSPVAIEEYASQADLVKNEVNLRSGTTCRYDRGFCYDPSEANTYAVVWDLLQRGKYDCPAQLFKVFDGDVDIWEFKPQNLTYLFFYDNVNDEAFYLKLDAEGQCQNNDVWYSNEGYIISLKALSAKDITPKLRLDQPTKNGKVSAGTGSYFTLRTKKVVSEHILKNCDVISLSFEALGELVTSDYLDNPHNLHVLLQRYYNLIMATKAELIALIESQSTLVLVKELQHQFLLLSQLLDKSRSEVVIIQQTLQEAGNLKGIRIDVDNLALQLIELIKKSEQYAEIIQKITIAVNTGSEEININTQELKSLTEKIALLQNILDNKLPEFITKTEVYSKIEKVEEDFHTKVKDLAMNVTMLILNQPGNDGVKGKARSRAEIEELILDKLNSFNVDQLQSGIDGIKEKVKIQLEQLKTESYNNITSLEERLLRKIEELEAQNVPILKRLDEYEQKLNDLLSQISNVKLDAEKFKGEVDIFEKETDSQITKILEKFGDFQQILNQIKEDLNTLSHKELDFTAVFEKVKFLIQEALKPVEKRLDALETISVQLTEDVNKGAKELVDLENQIKDIIDALKQLDSWKGDVSDDFAKEVEVVKNKIADSNAALDDHSKKQKDTNDELQNAKDGFRLEIEQLSNFLKELIGGLNSTEEENRDLIYKLQDEDRKIHGEIDSLKKNLGAQAKSLTDLESHVNGKCDSLETKITKNTDDIKNIKDNVTGLYDAVKHHEELILELNKKLEVAPKKDSSKGGSYKTVTYVKTAGHGGNNYQQKNSHLHSQTTVLIERQQEEIHILRDDLARALHLADSHGHRLSHLENKLDEILHKIIDGEKVLLNDVKILDHKIVETHTEVVHLEQDLRASISQCCSGSHSGGDGYAKLVFTKTGGSSGGYGKSGSSSGYTKTSSSGSYTKGGSNSGFGGSSYGYGGSHSYSSPSFGGSSYGYGGSHSYSSPSYGGSGYDSPGSSGKYTKIITTKSSYVGGEEK